MDIYDELPTSSLIYDENFEHLLESAKANKVSALTILTLSAKELVPLLSRSINEIQQFKEKLEKDYDDHIEGELSKNFLNQQPDLQCFTTGDLSIDKLLGGGIFTQNVTEIYGESSTGKSQFLMQLSLTVQLPKEQNGLQGKCVFISTEGDLFTNRVQQIIDTKYGTQNQMDTFSVSQNNIYYVNCSDLENQQHILNVQLPVLLEQDPEIKLVIIDSISHHIRAEHESHSFLESQKNRFNIEKLAANLLKMSAEKNIAFVVANQISNKVFNFQQYEDNRGSITEGHNEKHEARALNLQKYRECEKFDYQLGYIVGWKESNIRYTQMLINFKNTMNNEMLSDDEDISFLENLMYDVKEKERLLENAKTDHKLAITSNTKDTTNNGQLETHSTTSINVPAKRTVAVNRNPIKKRKYEFKKPVDTKIPTLGLTWANNITTRILLKKRMVIAPRLRTCPKDDISIEDLQPERALVKKRTMKLVFSTFSKSNKELDYIIVPNGIESLNNNGSNINK